MQKTYYFLIYSLTVLTLLSFTVIYLMVFKAPLFLDDTHWPIQNGRVLYDGLKMINLFPQCTSNFTWSVWLPLLPGRIFTSLIHPENLIGIRLTAMMKYASCIALLSGLAYWLFEKRISFFLLLASTTAMLSIGLLPIIMTLNRPETAIVVGSLLLVTAMLVSKHYKLNGMLSAGWAVIYLAIVSWLLSLHPKTQALIPAVFLLAWNADLSSRKIKILLLAGLLAMSISSIQLWRTHGDCPDHLPVETILKNHSVLPKDLWERPQYFRNQILKNLKASPDRYLPGYTHSEKYMGFLENAQYANQTSPSLKLFANYVNLSLLVYLLCAIAISSASHAANMVKSPHERIDWKWLLPPALLLPVIMVILMRHTPSVTKETGMFMCFFWFTLIWYTAANGWHHRFRKAIGVTCCLIMLAGLVNHIAFYQSWHKFFDYTGNPKNFRLGQYESFNRLQAIFDSPQRNQELLNLASRCNIKPDNSTKHLVVDDWTYMPFYKTFQPFYGRTLFRHGVPNNKPLRFLKQTGSDGVITLCSNLPWQLKPLATRQGDLCCISKERLYNP